MMCIRRGLDAPPIENKDLDEFVPEVRVLLMYLQLYLYLNIHLKESKNIMER